MTEKSYDIVFSFDTTGSMSACIKEVRKNVKSTIEKLFNDIKNIRIGLVAHGDYCDKDSSYLMKHIDLTTDQNKLIDFVQNVSDTKGGDYPEAYEYVLHKIQDLSWNSNAGRSLVMIGDAYPHEVNDNPDKLDWRKEVDEINNMGINIYSVQALYSGARQSYTFYKQMASKTNGYHLFLDQFNYITIMMVALCLKQGGDEDVIKYEQELKISLGGMSKSMRNMFDILLKRKKDDETDDHITNYNEHDDKLLACPPAKYQLMDIIGNTSIKDYVLANGLTFKVGKGYYEFIKPETISEKKEIVLMKKSTGELYEGKKARKIAGFKDNQKYKPSDLEEYNVFIQSTSANRKLIGGTRFLYEAADWKRI